MGGFDFGAFLGGMGEQISTNIEDAKKFNREKDFKLELLGEEEATKMRLARADEKREQRKNDQILAGRLKALGFDAGRSSFIMAQGSGYAEEMVTLAGEAYAKGYDPNAILKYGEGIEDMKLMVGPAGNTTKEFAPDFDFTADNVFKQDIDFLTSVRGPETRTFDTVKKKRDSILNTLSEMDPLDPELSSKMSELHLQSEYLLSEMVKEKVALAKAEQEGKESGKGPDTDTPAMVDLYSSSEVVSQMKIARDTVAGTYDLVSLEGAFEEVSSGAQAKSEIANIAAALSMQDSMARVYKKLPESVAKLTYNANGAESVASNIDSAISRLKSIGNATFRNASMTSGEEGRDDGLAMKFKGEFSLRTAIDAKLNYGDVVSIGGKLAVFTALRHTYGGWQTNEGTSIEIPFVYVNKNGDPQYEITKTSY